MLYKFDDDYYYYYYYYYGGPLPRQRYVRGKNNGRTQREKSRQLWLYLYSVQRSAGETPVITPVGFVMRTNAPRCKAEAVYSSALQVLRSGRRQPRVAAAACYAPAP